MFQSISMVDSQDDTIDVFKKRKSPENESNTFDKFKKQVDYKICVIGSEKVGKTTFIKLLVSNEIVEEYEKTTSIQNYSTNLTGKLTTKALQIWDTGSSDESNAILPIYYLKANLILMFYDVSDEESFKFAVKMHKEIFASCEKDKEPNIVLIGNKSDKIDDLLNNELLKKVDKFVKDFNIIHHTISLKNIKQNKLKKFLDNII